jgi:FkbM family methyltransferase
VRKNTVDQNVLDEVLVGDCYALKTLELPANPIVIDVGGHIGAFAKAIAFKSPDARVYVFEANPQNWSILEANLRTLGNRIQIHKCALVGSIPKNKNMFIGAGEEKRVTGGWGFTWKDENPVDIPRVLTKDFVLAEELFNSLERVDLLKLDCEGSEFNIIEHLSDDSMGKIKRFAAEIHVGHAHSKKQLKAFQAKMNRYFISEELVKPLEEWPIIFTALGVSR